MPKDWVRWHEEYDADSALARRLGIVRRLIGDVLLSRRDTSVSVISICSGDGRDLLGALSAARHGPIQGRLVELNPTLAAATSATIGKPSLRGIEVLNADAGDTNSYIGAVPADLVLACGVFGNISDADVERTIRAMPMLCSRDAAVIWTRHRRPPDLTPAIRRWFTEAGFVNTAFEQVPNSSASVGLALFRGEPVALVPNLRLFQFLP